MKNEFVYSLRIGICPDFYSEEKFQELLKFCEEAGINDIQFFTNMEEVNTGHPTMEETEPWLEMFAKFKPEIEKRGMTMSLNPWTTTLHTDRGRKLKEGQNFVTMADYNGKQAEAVACPLGTEFQNYLREMYGAYAKVGFDTIWVEDDFRLHNHSPLEWGGCFCDLHIKEFSERAGENLERSGFLDGVIKTGEPHPYRKIWLDTAKDTMVDFARLLGNAVHDIAPNTRVGLMSSAPEVHCAEGRDWGKVFENLSGNTRPLNRPHLPAYGEGAARQFGIDFQKFSRLTAAITGKTAELWPELDNLPHTTYSKSHRFAKMEIESSLALGAEGITINIFDMIGNGISPRQKNEKMLAEIKPYLNGVKALGYKGTEEQGVHVMYSTDSAYTIHADGKRSLTAIQPNETFWAEYLGVYGISYKYCDNPEMEGKIVAVAGQYFRNLTHEQITNLFEKNIVLLEGEAAETLYEMGLGRLAGIGSCEWYPLNGGKHSYEQVRKDLTIQDLPEARISAQSIYEAVETGDYLHITYGTENLDVLTEMMNYDGTVSGHGLTTVENRVVIFPYGHMRAQYYFLLNPIRQELFTKLLLSFKDRAKTPVIAEECQFVSINDFAKDDRHILFLMNYATDDFEDVWVNVPFNVEKVFEVSRKDGQLAPIEVQKDGNRICIPGCLEHMKSRCICCYTK